MPAPQKQPSRQVPSRPQNTPAYGQRPLPRQAPARAPGPGPGSAQGYTKPAAAAKPKPSTAKSVIITVIAVILIVWIVQMFGSKDGVPHPVPTVTPQPTGGIGLGNFCGNGMLDPGEECDGNVAEGVTCASFGFASGEVLCSQCKIVTSGCVKEASAILAVSAIPTGIVMVDGQEYGLAPQTVTLSPGEHEVVVQLEGYEPYVRRVSVAAGEHVDVAAILVKQKVASGNGLLVVKTFPVGATIFINQSYVGSGPWNVTVPAGQDYALLITASGYRFRGEVGRLGEGEVREFFAVLSRK